MVTPYRLATNCYLEGCFYAMHIGIKINALSFKLGVLPLIKLLICRGLYVSQGAQSLEPDLNIAPSGYT